MLGRVVGQAKVAKKVADEEDGGPDVLVACVGGELSVSVCLWDEGRMFFLVSVSWGLVVGGRSAIVVTIVGGFHGEWFFDVVCGWWERKRLVGVKEE